VFALALALTAGALAALHAAVPRPRRALELAVLVAANLAATVLRFLLLRGWVFRPSPRTASPTPAPSEPGPPIVLTGGSRGAQQAKR
jgi:hypothetical protein